MDIVLPTFQQEGVTINGKNYVTTTSKLFKLYYHYSFIKKSISTTDNLKNYLVGNEEFYDDNFFKNIEIHQALNLEIRKQILVEYNDKYGFEDDIYFTNQVNDVFKFKDFNTIFKSLESYQFTIFIMKSFVPLRRNYIESLYQVLLNFNLIIDNKTEFIAFMKSEFNFIIPKISSFKPKENLQFDKRVLEISKKWENRDVIKTEIDIFKSF